MKSILDSLANLEASLQSHSSMNEEQNPVLSHLRTEGASETDLEFVLAQYSLLPARIVEFLSVGASRLQQWSSVKGELERNISEEMGSRTEGLSHYAILKRAVLRELGLNVTSVEPVVSTDRFLNSVKSGLLERPESFVAGMLYGLEASAVPELTVVAKLINEYARTLGLDEPINLSGLNARSNAEETPVGDKYSLNVFFSSHLWDFEVGHRKRLASTLIQDLPSSPADIQYLESGFEYVLAEMDKWWGSLGSTIAHFEQHEAQVPQMNSSKTGELPLC
jgi:hypothetical protein